MDDTETVIAITMKDGNVFHVTVPPGKTVEDVLAKLSEHDENLRTWEPNEAGTGWERPSPDA